MLVKIKIEDGKAMADGLDMMTEIQYADPKHSLSLSS